VKVPYGGGDGGGESMLVGRSASGAVQWWRRRWRECIGPTGAQQLRVDRWSVRTVEAQTKTRPLGGRGSTLGSWQRHWGAGAMQQRALVEQQRVAGGLLWDGGQFLAQ